MCVFEITQRFFESLQADVCDSSVEVKGFGLIFAQANIEVDQSLLILAK
jgi:hypothetical protein